MKNLFQGQYLSKIKKKTSLLVVLFILIFLLSASFTVNAEDPPDISVSNVIVSYSNGLIFLETKDAELSDVLKAISNKTGVKINCDERCRENISVKLSNISLENALKQIVKNRAMYFKKDENGKFSLVSVEAYPKDYKGNEVSKNTKTISQQYLSNNVSEIKKDYRHINDSLENPDYGNKTNNESNAEFKSKKNDYVPNEILVHFSKIPGRDEMSKLLLPFRASIKKRIDKLNYYLISFPSDFKPEEIKDYLTKKSPYVQSAEPNILIPIESIPNDFFFSKQWSLIKNTDLEPAVKAHINVADVWDIENGNPDVVVAVIDTGVDYNHEDLVENIWHNPGEIPSNGIDDDNNGYVDDVIGWDFVDAFEGAKGEDLVDSDNDPTDGQGHGTHISGIISASGNNKVGIAGISWKSKIMALRAGYKTSSGSATIESASAAEAIIYAADNGAKIINISWGDSRKSEVIENAIDYASKKDVLICAAAGNQNSKSNIYPAALPNPYILSVGATDSEGKKASFSNYGEWVDLSAPGVDIYSTFLKNGYIKMSGTSMAVPHVSGLAALLASHFKNISALGVKAKIMRSADVDSKLNGKNILSGRINSYSAISAVFTEPHIFSVTPSPIREGKEFSIFGDSFGESKENGKVIFNSGNEGEVVSWSNYEISCLVPFGAESGALNVVTDNGTSNEISVEVLKEFYLEKTVKNNFLKNGKAQGWNGDDNTWEYTLPFKFPFYGKKYDTVFVCSNGFLDFQSKDNLYLNNNENFKAKTVIAPLWDDLKTNGNANSDEDIYIYMLSPDAISFRWQAEQFEKASPVNVEAILFSNGNIQFNYGEGNSGLSPTVGLSGGNDEEYHFASYDSVETLEKADSLFFEPRKDTLSIKLVSGWNLISIPLEPENNSISSIMSSSLSEIESVWGFINGEWMVYKPGEPEISNMGNLLPGYGYWIKSSGNVEEILVSGKQNNGAATLTKGWNLIGFNNITILNTSDVISSLSEEVEIVWAYDNGKWNAYDPKKENFSDLYEIEPGRAFWLKVK